MGKGTQSGKIINFNVCVAIPGHIVEVVNDNGEVLPPGEVGVIAVKTPDPVVFLKYWNNPEATAVILIQ